MSLQGFLLAVTDY